MACEISLGKTPERLQMAMNNGRQDLFQDRLKRISAGGPNTMSQVYVGPAETSDRGVSKKSSGSGRDLLDNVLYPMSLIGAFVIGAISVILARLARFYLLGGGLTGENSDLWMIVDGVLALGIVISLRSVFRISGKMLNVSKALGIITMILTMHMFVHTMPDTFSSVFSPEWTANVIKTTIPDVLLFNVTPVLSDLSEKLIPKTMDAAPAN